MVGVGVENLRHIFPSSPTTMFYICIIIIDVDLKGFISLDSLKSFARLGSSISGGGEGGGGGVVVGLFFVMDLMAAAASVGATTTAALE